MAVTTIIGIVGTLLALGAIVFGIRMQRSPERGGAFLGPLYMLFGLIFIPVIWFMILVLMPESAAAQ